MPGWYDQQIIDDAVGLNSVGGAALMTEGGASRDAFARFRVSDPTTLFDSQLQYDLQPLLWESSTTGGATVVHLTHQAAARLRCGTASGDKAIRQTRAYHRYQPGKSQMILLTGVVGAAKANVRKRLGYFDALNGIFLEQTAAGVSWVRRTYWSGAVVDTAIAQANWSLDPLDGSGASGITLDLSKSQILLIDLEWLGVGRVRVGFVIGGIVFYAHEFLHANTDHAGVYMSTANLPLRYEIENTAGAASATDLIQICGSVNSEGGFEEGRGIPFSASRGASAVAVTTRRPLLAIRPRDTFGGVVNRGTILPVGVEVLALTKCAFLEVVYGGAVSGGGPTWTDVDNTYSIAQKCVDATGITGGLTVASFYVPAAAQGASRAPGAQRINLLSRLPLTLNIAGTHPTSPLSDVLAVVATTAEGSDASNVYAGVNWQELY